MRQWFFFFDKVVIKQRIVFFLTTIWSFLWFYAAAYLVSKKKLHKEQMKKIYKFIMQSNASFIFVRSLLLTDMTKWILTKIALGKQIYKNEIQNKNVYFCSGHLGALMIISRRHCGVIKFLKFRRMWFTITEQELFEMRSFPF